jgi:hypothetical protein
VDQQTSQMNISKKRGFGSPKMDPARLREIAAMGGRAAQRQGSGHRWTPEEAREFGRKGGKCVWDKQRAAGKTGPLGAVDRTAGVQPHRTLPADAIRAEED